MEKIFCPFIKGNCVPECVFNNGCYNEGDVENCNLNDAVDMIRSFGFQERTLESYLDKIGNASINIQSDASSISSNTGFDNTESWEINENLKKILKIISHK